jgi:murein DD-endopeptidase MepM/ murein hydrolase activator NlpD
VTIRTPDDEITTAGYFLPPFKAGRTYQGVTYAGHSDFAVDFNRRTPEGAWLADAGDPVLSAADGIVVQVNVPDGFVMVQHKGGYRTEYRHMVPVEVSKGQRVRRGDRLGKIGDAGNAPNGTHLHHRHWQRIDRVWRAIPMTFATVRVGVSVMSDNRPEGWEPPAPVYVVGPPRRATWERAYKAAERALAACEARCPVEVPE